MLILYIIALRRNLTVTALVHYESITANSSALLQRNRATLRITLK